MCNVRVYKMKEFRPPAESACTYIYYNNTYNIGMSVIRILHIIGIREHYTRGGRA